MITQDRHGSPGFHQLLCQGQYRRAVRSPVAEVTYKNLRAVLRVVALLVTTKVAKQAAQGVIFAMDVANYVQRTIGKG